MATHFLIKAESDGDSYYQSLIVDAHDEQSARGAAERYVQDSGARLLVVDASATRQVPGHAASWHEHSTPFGRVAAGGRVFIVRRFATAAFREVTSMEYAGVSVEAMSLALKALCRESRMMIVVVGAHVPGGTRLRSGLGVVYLIDANDSRLLPAVQALLAEQRQGCALFILRGSDRSALAAYSGIFMRSSALRKALVEMALCVIEEGDFLCRGHFIAEMMRTVEEAKGSDSMHDIRGPDRE